MGDHPLTDATYGTEDHPMLDAERNARAATAGVVGALAWIVFAWVLAPITLAITWLIGVLTGVPAFTLGVVVGSAWLLLVLAPRALRGS